jgi:predicted DNA binding CopG/RHH family protein
MPRPFLPEGVSKQKKLEVRMSVTEMNEIKEFATSQNITVSTLFRRALKQYARWLREGKTTKIGEFPDTF